MYSEQQTTSQNLARHIAIVLVAFLCAYNTGVIAKPELKEETQYYAISGDSAEALRREMNSKSNISENGKTFDAYTRWNVRWNFNWENTASYCSMTTVTTSVDINFTLPSWVDRDSAPAALRKKWDRYYAALIEHEHGHKEFGVKAAKAIELSLSGMGRDTCSALQRDSGNQANKILEKYIAREKQYDIDTRHGMDDGAVFP